MSFLAQSFAHTFLLHDGVEPGGLTLVEPTEFDVRRKKAHRKSRNGCHACKRRKVKCDERSPCANCVKRGEACSKSAAHDSHSGDDYEPIIRNPDPLPNTDLRANLLHLELFHHFTKITIPTLSFTNVWDSILPLSFHEEYLMTAMLAISARHLSYLCPDESRYSRAAMMLLSRSCAHFRSVLGRELTARNCDAVLGTAILIHYLTWCDLDFLEEQNLDDIEHHPLDLGQDKLFILSSGVRHILFIAWPVLETCSSSFVAMTLASPCDIIKQLVDDRGYDWESLAKLFMKLYDDPSFSRNRTPGLELPSGQSSSSASTPSADAPSPGTCGNRSGKLHESDVGQHRSLNGSMLPALAPKPPDGSSEEQEMAAARDSYEQVANRLAVILAFLTEYSHKSAAYEPPSSEIHPTSFAMVKRSDIERYFLSLPLLCCGPFQAMIQSGDSRAFVLLFHMYRTARLQLGTQESWWAAKRSAVMEGLLQRELKARGFDGCLRHSMGSDSTSLDSGGCPMMQIESSSLGVRRDRACSGHMDIDQAVG